MFEFVWRLVLGFNIVGRFPTFERFVIPGQLIVCIHFQQGNESAV